MDISISRSVGGLVQYRVYLQYWWYGGGQGEVTVVMLGGIVGGGFKGLQLPLPNLIPVARLELLALAS